MSETGRPALESPSLDDGSGPMPLGRGASSSPAQVDARPLRRSLSMAAAGLALLLAGGAGLQHWFEARLQQERATGTTTIIVARHALDQGSAIGGLDWRAVSWPAESVPEDAILDASGLEGRVLAASLQAGEPILMAKLAPVGAMTGLVQRLRPGHRALSVKVNEASGVNGFVQPGHRVDVIAHLPGVGASGSGVSGSGALARSEEAVSLTVLQDLAVLAVDREASTEQAKPRQTAVVTLAVTPLEAERLEHARSAGTISLVLRADGDHSPWTSRGQTRASLREAPTVVQAMPVPPQEARTPPIRTGPASAAQQRVPAAVQTVPAGVPTVPAAVQAVPAAVPTVPAGVQTVPTGIQAIDVVAGKTTGQERDAAGDPVVATGQQRAEQTAPAARERSAADTAPTDVERAARDATAKESPGTRDFPRITDHAAAKESAALRLAAGTADSSPGQKPVGARRVRCIEVYDGERRHQECLP